MNKTFFFYEQSVKNLKDVQGVNHIFCASTSSTGLHNSIETKNILRLCVLGIIVDLYI